jgi:hypothetical protein
MEIWKANHLEPSITSRRRSGWLHATASDDAASMRLVCVWYAFSLRLTCVWYAFRLRLTRSHRRKAWGAGFGQSSTDCSCRRFVRITAVCAIAQGAKRGNKKVGSVGTVTNSQKFHHFGRMQTDRLIPSVRAMRPQAKRIKRYLQRLIMFGVNFVMFETK